MSLLQELINEGYSHNRANVDDLALFVDNDAVLKEVSHGIIKRCGKKYVANYWRRFADRAAKAYSKKMHDDPSLWNRLFSVSDRKKAMKELFTQAKDSYQEHLDSLDKRSAEENEEMARAMHHDRYHMMGIEPPVENEEETYGEHDPRYDHSGGDEHLDVDDDYDETKEKKRGTPELDNKLASAFITGKYKR